MGARNKLFYNVFFCQKSYRSLLVCNRKIHGANFCWIVSKNELLCVKRKAILRPSDEFFHYQRVKETLTSNIREVFESVLTVTTCQRIYIYGELFGGCYPHPDISPDSRVAAVQTGIYYAPRIEFCAFDIAVESPQGIEYLDYLQSVSIYSTSWNGLSIAW